MKNKKALIVVILAVILLVSIYFGATWLFEQIKGHLEHAPKHFRPTH